MSVLETVSILQVATGALIMLGSIFLGLKVTARVPEGLRRQWKTAVVLMTFFFAGYLLFIVNLIVGRRIPLELVTGTIFMGGAFFVYGVTNITRATIKDIRLKKVALEREEAERKELLQSLENRVRERTEQIHAERAFLQDIIDGVVDPTMVIGSDHRVLLMNRAAREYLPFPEPCAKELFCYRISHRRDSPCDDSGDHPCPLQHVLRTGQATTVVHTHRMRDGSVRQFELQASPLRGENGELKGMIESARDITDRLRAEEMLRENQSHLDFLAHHDPLTRLPNRLLLHDRLRHAMAKALLANNRLALLFLDLDRFKIINDSLGHESGDQLLCEVARRLRQELRDVDTVARMGGDEFVILLEQIENPREVSLIAGKILDNLAKPLFLGRQEVFVTTSIGISFFPGDAPDLETLMQTADVAMYRAKEQGRNNFQFYKPEMNARIQERLRLEGELRRGLEEGQMVLHYHPQVDLISGRVAGMEALVRWASPERGLVLPGEFIPIAEETGLIIPLGEWVLRSACTQGRIWHDRGLPVQRVAVNISARQFRQPDFLSMVDAILEETGLAPGLLEFEITESIAMENVDSTIQILGALQQRGVHLSIDDFGTGYSSLSYLRRFPVSKLKIDRSFVRDAATDGNDGVIASSVIALGRSMGLEVVAEGVETWEQVAFLRRQGCRLGQGYFFSRPVPAGTMERILREGLETAPSEGRTARGG